MCVRVCMLTCCNSTNTFGLDDGRCHHNSRQPTPAISHRGQWRVTWRAGHNYRCLLLIFSFSWCFFFLLNGHNAEWYKIKWSEYFRMTNFRVFCVASVWKYLEKQIHRGRKFFCVTTGIIFSGNLEAHNTDHETQILNLRWTH